MTDVRTQLSSREPHPGHPMYERVSTSNLPPAICSLRRRCRRDRDESYEGPLLPMSASYLKTIGGGDRQRGWSDLIVGRSTQDATVMCAYAVTAVGDWQLARASLPPTPGPIEADRVAVTGVCD